MKYQHLGKGVIKRTEQRRVALFIDGTGLDRAARRINRKVEMSSLVRGVTSGAVPVVARYYTLIPYEDDSRQRAFLDAVSRANLQVIVKRLPPKGVTRQVTVDVEMAADIIAFALGHSMFSDLSEYKAETPPPRMGSALPSTLPFRPLGSTEQQPSRLHPQRQEGSKAAENAEQRQSEHDRDSDTITSDKKGPARKEKRIITVVCPSRELAYPISLANELGVETTSADFGKFNTGDILKCAAKWIDLSDSETIWRE